MTLGELARRAWWWLTRTFAGRLVLVSLAIKAVVWTVRVATQSMTALSALSSIATLLLLIAVVAIGYRTYVHVKSVVLWRVRRKLTLSYVFIGFVPVLLLVLFFCVATRTVQTTALMPSDTSTSRPANVRVSHHHVRRASSPDVTGSSAACGSARPSLRLQLLSEYARPS